jgi:hypothetical protein
MKGISVVFIGLATVFVAVVTLFYIFDQIQKLADDCAANPTFNILCKQFTGFTQSLLIIILIIAGFVIIITATAFILLSS